MNRNIYAIWVACKYMEKPDIFEFPITGQALTFWSANSIFWHGNPKHWAKLWTYSSIFTAETALCGEETSAFENWCVFITQTNKI